MLDVMKLYREFPAGGNSDRGDWLERCLKHIAAEAIKSAVTEVALLTAKTGDGIVLAVAVSANWLVHVHDRYGLPMDGACAQCTGGSGIDGWVCYYHQAKTMRSPQRRSECPYCTSDNEAIRSTYYDQTCEGCVRRMGQ